jgi:hypothetical protein
MSESGPNSGSKPRFPITSPACARPGWPALVHLCPCRIQGLLDGITFKRNAYSLDRSSREAALAQLFDEAKNDQKPTDQPPSTQQQAA